MPKRKKTEQCAELSAKPPKLFLNLLKTTRQYIEGRNYAPLSLHELMQKLALPEQHKKIFVEILQTLEKEKCIRLKRGLYEPYGIEESVITGTISMHPRGFGFVKPDQVSAEGDVFIPKHLTLNAVDGDHVEVAINTEIVSDKGPEGKVLAILSRNRTHVAGIITSTSEYGEIVAHVPLLGTGQRILVEPNDSFSLKEGDRVVMQVLDWGSRDQETLCTVSHHLGHISNPSCDIEAAIEEYELQKEFPHQAILEAESFGKQVSQKDIAARKDLRHLECFTIDPTTAKDFDDALTLSKDKKGYYHLIVHIADVSHYVAEGSALDKEASKRCNSTYFPGKCLPMLPPALSENLCSLKANVNRLAVSVAMDFDPKGNLVSQEIFRSVIKSSKRFTYTDAKEVLDGKRKSAHAPTLKLMVELCNLLKIKRFQRGSIEFALPDLVIQVDSHGVPTGTEYVSYDITHQMVEEFMLKANETIAQHLDNAGKSVAYRIHEEPSEENMKDFSILASAFGFKLPENPKPHQLQELFNEAMSTPYGQYLAVSYIRRMRQALYSPNNVGHYGLGLTHYCHFTSPIRRYIDLVIHRSLFSTGLDVKKLEKITKQCSDQERISAKAENSVTLLKKLRLLDAIHQKTPYKEYEAVITRVKNFGFSFEVLDFLLEGFLHVSELDQDYFVFDDQKMRLVGRHTRKLYASGERITVLLKKVDFISLESQWTLVAEHPNAKQERSKNKKTKKSRSQLSTPPKKAKPKATKTSIVPKKAKAKTPATPKKAIAAAKKAPKKTKTPTKQPKKKSSALKPPVKSPKKVRPREK